MGSLKELPKVYFERLLESSPDIVVAVDRNGAVIFYNDGAENILGYHAEEILGHPVARIYPNEEEARRVMAALRSSDTDGPGRIKNFETEFMNKDGTRVPVAISGSIITNERGHEHGSIGFAKDIKSLKDQERMATLGQLAIGLAHEINNPLEVLVNHVDLLERYLKQKATQEDYTREHERIDSVKRELRRIQAIVERVGEMADDGDYETCEYLPGRLMTDLALVEELPAEPPPSGPHCSIGGRRVLVVDDDSSIRSSMADILGCEGCNVFTTDSGVEALRFLQTNNVDLVLSDVVMPDMDGYELFQEIRDLQPDLPVVLMTAYYYDKDHVIKRSKADGLEDVIFKKPIDPTRLVALVDARSTHH